MKQTAARLEQREDDSSSDMPREAASLALRLSAELSTPATLNRSNLHAYRVKIKELRYVLQMADNASQQRFVDVLGQCKDAIGEWHDWEELIAIADSILNHSSGCQLLRDLRATSQRKYEFALSITNKMRRDYLRSSTTNRKRKASGKIGLAQPVIRAISATAA